MTNFIKILPLILIIFPKYYFSQVKVHKHISTEDGLISNQILSIFQDSKGYMWFGTFKGISIWDGNNFDNISKDEGLTSSAVLDLLETPDSTIFISAFGKGLMTLKNNKLDTIDVDDGLGTNFILKLRLINGNPIFITYPIQTFKNNELETFFENPDILEGAITDFYLDEDSTIYVSSKKGFYVKNRNREKVYTEADGLRTSVTSFIEKDKYGNILIATSEGLNKFADGKITTLMYNDKPVDWTISDILCASDSTNYYSGDNGLLIEKDGKIELLTTENGLLENPIFTLGEDNYGNIYLGYNKSGISIYSPEKFTNYTSPEFAATTIIKNKNELFLGTEYGITILNEDKIKRITTSNGLISNFIRKVAQNSNDEILVGTDLGLNILKNDKIKSTFKAEQYTQGIYDIEFSYNNDLLMAVRRQGITLLSETNISQNSFLKTFVNTNDTSNRKISTGHGTSIFGKKNMRNSETQGKILNYINRSNGLLSSWILDLLLTKDSTLVMGYHGSGASFYKNGKFKHLTKEDGLTDGIIQTIFENSDGSLWFGTGQGGICIYNFGKIIDTIDVDDGLSSNDIRGIVQFRNLFYVATNIGLNRIETKNENWFIKKIDKNDGLISNNCNINALYLDGQNSLWIGTPKGLTKFNPKTEKPITNSPNVYLTGLEIFNKTYPIEELKKSKKLDYNNNYLKFFYTGINLSAPEKVIYKYKLDGIDKEWITSNDNNVQYTSLDDGDYTFEVKAKNEWGYWSEPASLSFVINPAWWETWWARLSFAATLGFLLWLAFQYRLNYLLKLERLRTKIASDLHDEVGSMLTQISLNADFLSFTKDEKKKEEKSKFIRTKTNEIINIMNDIIWSIDSRNDNLESLVERIRNFAYDHCSQKDIKLNFIKNIDNDHKSLKITFRQNIMLIAKEAINNAVKYSDCTELLIEIKLLNSKFELSINDNGKSFDFENVRKGNGLKNMKMRANSINAKIIFKNENGFSIKVTKDKI